MLNSKLIVSTMKYKVNDALTPQTCNMLLNIVDKTLSNESFQEKLNIIHIDNTLSATTSGTNINIVVETYIMTKLTKGIVKEFKSYIDTELTTIQTDELVAKMIRRKVY